MWFFKSKERTSVVLISIGSSSVAGAYVHYKKGELPALYYSVRIPIKMRDEETIQAAMLRSLDAVGNELVEKGAPVLRRETGSGHADGVLISVAEPWQETAVRTETIQPGKPFVFTKRVLSEAVASSAHVPEGKVSFGESVIATILNGYPITSPLGKTVNRAEIVILSSTLDKQVTEDIRAHVRKLYHAHDIQFTAFAPVAYSVMRDMYPHEKDFLVLHVSSQSTDLAFVKGGLLVDVGTLPMGIESLLSATHAAERMTIDEEQGMGRVPSEQPGYINPDRNARFSIRAEEARDEWLKALAELFKRFAQLHALPRTLFLLTKPEARDYLKRALDNNILHTLWLSDEPLAIISATPEQFASRVTIKSEAEADIFISILAVYEENLLKK